MTNAWLTRRRMAVVVVVAALLIGGTALLSPSVVVSHPVSSGVLGDQWQCRSLAMLTTCTRVEMVTPVAHGMGTPSPGPDDDARPPAGPAGQGLGQDSGLGQGRHGRLSIKFETLR